jgi:membrane protease YdiL (CAAX protease family)
MPFTLAILAVVSSWTWFLEQRAPGRGVIAIGLVVVALTTWHDARHRAWGFDWRAFWPALWRVLAVTLAAGLVMLAAGAVLETLHDRRDFLGSLVPLIAWALAQQWVLQSVILAEAQRATSRQTGVWITAAIFGAIHLPNPLLSAVTFGGGLLWCGIYTRYPNILPLALSQALGTLAILHSFSPAIRAACGSGFRTSRSTRRETSQSIRPEVDQTTRTRP